MKNLTQPMRQVLDRVQRRFVRSRPGSVLILVVALLILMAIIGTAFMSMAQSDSGTAVIHSNNTEIDLLLDGLVEVVKSAVVNDLSVQGSYRPVARYNTGEPGSYNYTTGLGDPSATVNPGTLFLASRVPELFSETGGPIAGSPSVNPVPTTTNPPLWRFITAPLLGGQFSSPVPPQYVAPTHFLDGDTFGNPPYVYSQRASHSGQPLLPGSMLFNGQNIPAWVDRPLGATHMMPAADADGDGIADSGYVKLPMGAINGVTYYAAIRIVDNNAAINANTAWQHNPLTAGATGTTSPQLPGDFFTSNIDLLDLLRFPDGNTADPASGISRLLKYRFGTYLLAAAPVPTPTSSANAYNDDPPNYIQQRTDFPTYATMTEAEWMGLGRRIRNPGQASDTFLYNRLPISEALNMARNFVLRDPGVANTNASPSLLEQYLPWTVAAGTKTAPYDPSSPGVLQWFTDNFTHLLGFQSFNTNSTNIRSMLTSENAVSEFVPSKFRDLGKVGAVAGVPVPPAGTSFQFGDSIIWNGNRYVCINPIRASNSTTYFKAILPGAGYVDPGLTYPSKEWAKDNDTWIYQPWMTNPTRTSVNTATFGQLMLAYWSVMAEKPWPTPAAGPSTPDVGQWQPPFPLNPGALPASVDSPRMFRSPMRVPTDVSAPTTLSPNAWRLSPMQVMQLRSAIAAVNTLDMRDNDDNVTARVVHLVDADLTSQPNTRMQDVIATVYGTERQPFITKVYATNEANASDPLNPQPGYIAIELYNPDPLRPMSLSRWALGIINRYQTGYIATAKPNLNPTIVPIAPPDPDWFDTAATRAPIIPPLGSIVIASGDTPPAGITLPPTVVKPPLIGVLPPGQTALYIVHNLIPPGNLFVAGGPWGALGSELMLFRPRNLDPVTGGGVPTSSLGTKTAPLTSTPTPIFPFDNGGDFFNAHPYPYYNEGTVTAASTYTPNLADMVPIDSYDFTGLNTLPVGATTPTEWYYVRPNDRNTKSWHFVYPGHYAMLTPGASPTPVVPRLIDGTWSSDLGTSNGIGQALAQAAVPTPGQIPFGIEQTAAKAEYRDIPLVLNTVDFAGPNARRGSSSPGNQLGFPYGGFARNGDIMEVPFIGAYRLEIIDPPTAVNLPPTVIELNPATMDSVMALGLTQTQWGEPAESNFTGLSTNPTMGNPIVDPALLALSAPIENVGRFAPIGLNDFRGPAATLTTVRPNDYLPTPAATVNLSNPLWLYHFATRLFDYLTVQSPQQDYTPDVDPALSDPAQLTLAPYLPIAQLPKFSPPAFNLVTPVANVINNVYNGEPTNPTSSPTEETAPVAGLVNINTASWRVLAAVPWVPPDYPTFGGSSVGNSRQIMNVDIGLSIARYRDLDDNTGSTPTHGHGPFKSLYELLDVPIYPMLPISLPTTPTLLRNVLKTGPPIYSADQGILAPAYGGVNPAPILGDFQSKYIMLNRVSNLVTTRSDSFTAYILIQGWQNPETPNATLAVTRRAAFLIDRSNVTGAIPTPPPTITYVPTGN